MFWREKCKKKKKVYNVSEENSISKTKSMMDFIIHQNQSLLSEHYSTPKS